MSEMEKLAELIKQQRKQAEDQKAKNEQLIGFWKTDLAGLIKTIERWVEPLRREGLAKVSTSEKDIHESPHPDINVRYTVPTLLVELGAAKIRITPFARYVVGSTGRVDIEGLNNYNEVRIVRTEQDGSPAWELAVKERGPKAKLEYQPLNENTFAKLLQSAL